MVGLPIVGLLWLFLWVHLTLPESSGVDASVIASAAQGRMWGDPGVLRMLSNATNTGPMTAAIIVIGLGLAAGASIRRSVVFVAMTSLSALVVSLLKATVGRARPQLVEVPGSYAWPSGHSAGALTFALALTVALAWVSRRHALAIGLVMVPLALAVGYSRVFLLVHWPSDVLGGWLASFLAVGIVLAYDDGAHEVPARQPWITYVSVAVGISVMLTLGLRTVN